MSPASPLLAGFRLDAYSAIKPRVTHSPALDVHNQIFSSFLDDRYISPAVLYIQVSVLQVHTGPSYTAFDVFLWSGIST